jgi:hypothetical protein
MEINFQYSPLTSLLLFYQVALDGNNDPHFPLPPLEMNALISRLCAKYDIDFSVWYPVSGGASLEQQLRSFVRLDSILFPSGDPGDLSASQFLQTVANLSAAVHRIHSNAHIWVTSQEFDAHDTEQFYRLLASESLAWLHGVAYGPHTRDTIMQVRQRVPSRFPLRHYPDLCHTLKAQFPVPDWSSTFAFTAARESIVPRPLQQQRIFRLHQVYTIGFGGYSDGVNDDLNKIIWSALGWNVSSDLRNDVLADYARYFFRFSDSQAQTESVIDGFLCLEQNWNESDNNAPQSCFHRWQALENAASPQLLTNWRFLLALYRAYYDFYQLRRQQFSDRSQKQALDELSSNYRNNPSGALRTAQLLLAQSPLLQMPELLAVRTRIFTLAEALYQSIGMKLSLPLYRAKADGRGESLGMCEEWL